MLCSQPLYYQVLKKGVDSEYVEIHLGAMRFELRKRLFSMFKAPLSDFFKLSIISIPEKMCHFDNQL